MRSTCTVQPSVFEAPEIVHPVADELERAWVWLDQHPELLELIGACVPGCASGGRHGLTCETILRCGVLMHLMSYSYRGWSSRCSIPPPCSASRGSIRCARRRSRRAECDRRRHVARHQRRAAAGREAVGDRIGDRGAYRQHGDRDGHPATVGQHPATVGQPPVVRRRAGADAAAAGSRCTTTAVLPSDAPRRSVRRAGRGGGRPSTGGC